MLSLHYFLQSEAQIREVSWQWAGREKGTDFRKRDGGRVHNR